MANDDKNLPEEIKNILEQVPALSSLTGDSARFIWFSTGADLVKTYLPYFELDGPTPEDVAVWINNFVKQMEKTV